MKICYLNKEEKQRWLPVLFDLLYENMRFVTPSGLDYALERQAYLAEVSAALEKEPRQILLCLAGDEVAGFLQYYVCGQLLMIEELQIRKAYQQTTVFYCLCRYLSGALPVDLQTVEAYADKRNIKSVCLMERLGMAVCAEEGDTPFFRFCGSAPAVIRRFRPGFGRKT